MGCVELNVTKCNQKGCCYVSATFFSEQKRLETGLQAAQ